MVESINGFFILRETPMIHMYALKSAIQLILNEMNVKFC